MHSENDVKHLEKEIKHLEEMLQEEIHRSQRTVRLSASCPSWNCLSRSTTLRSMKSHSSIPRRYRRRLISISFARVVSSVRVSRSWNGSDIPSNSKVRLCLHEFLTDRTSIFPTGVPPQPGT